MTSTAIDAFRGQKLRTHQQALKTGRSAAQLLTVATQLKETCRRLQEERSQLLRQQHLLWNLAEVLSGYRASLQGNWGDLSTADLEQVLLQQLTGVHVPSMTSTSHWPSTDSSAASNDSISSATGSGQSSEQTVSDTSDVGSESSRESSLDQSLGQSSTADWCSSLCTLSTLGISTAGCANAATAADNMQSLQQQADQPVCPPHDPFMLLQQAMDQPQDPHAAHITLAGLCARWAADVQQLREYLTQLETGSHASTDPAPAESSSHPSSRAGMRGADGAAHSSAHVPAQPATDPLQGIKDVQQAMFVMTWSLPFVNKGHLFFELQLTDWHTGERLQEPCKQRHMTALRALQLTPAQLQRMATGWQLFQRLLQPLVRMRKQLHARGVQVPDKDQDGGRRPTVHSTDAAPLQQPRLSSTAAECHGASSRGDAGDSSSNNPSGSGAVTGVFAGNSSHGARLQAQQEQVVEMRVLMRKDMLLRGAMAMHLQGCMSWRQQAKLRVMMSPYQLNVGIFYVVLMEHIQQEQPQVLATLRQQPTPQAAASSTGALFGAAAGAAAGAATTPSPFLGRGI